MDSATRRHHTPERTRPPGPRADREDGPGSTASQRLLAIVRTALPKGALILVVVTFVGYAVGLLKDKVMAHTFGAGPDTDAFNAAFTVPALALEVLLMGGLLACFVPVFVGLRDESEEEARAFARTVLTLAILIMTAAVGILFVFAEPAVAFVAPGFHGDQLDLCVNLFRLLCVTQIIFAASWVIGEVLIAEQRWAWYGLATAMYGGGIIVGTLLLGDQLGIYAAAVGAIGGAVAHLGIRLVGVLRTQYKPWFSFNLRVKGLREYVWLSLPKMISQPMDMLTVLYFTRLASTLEVGSVTRLTYARQLETLPVLLIGTQFALAAFPALSQAVDQQDGRRFKKIFSTNLATIMVLSTAAALGALFLGRFAISIVLGGGAFTPKDVNDTAMLLAVFSVAIPLEAASELLARSMYANRNTALPTAAQIAGFAAVVATAQTLAPTAGILAIPAAYGMGMLVKLIVLAWALRSRMEAIGRPAVAPLSATAYGAAGGGFAQASPTPALARRRATGSGRGRRPILQKAAGATAVALLLGTGLYTAVLAAQGASFGFSPNTTPWARVRPSAVIGTPSPTPTPAMTYVAWPTWTPVVPATPTPVPTPEGQFAMDLFHEGDYVGEMTNKWCIPAAMQTMMNIMDEGADVSQETQNRLFDLGISIAQSRQGVPEPEAWAQGLTQLGYGHFKVTETTTRQAAIALVVKQIRITNRPAGLLVWYGWHAWVVSGFVASADPALTDDYVVNSLFIEDVWYPRHSKIWNKDRDGYSRPPDSEVPGDILYQDYKTWDQAVSYPDYQGKYVLVIPVP